MANAQVGDWVLYTLDEGSRPGVERPALVVDVNEDESVDLLIFTAGVNDGLGYHMRYVHGVRRGGEHGEYTTRQVDVPEQPAPNGEQATALILAGHEQDGTPVYGPYSADQMRYFAEHGTFPDAHGVIEAPR